MTVEDDVDSLLALHVHVALDDVAGSKEAVLLPLRDRVLVGGLAEIADVVSGDLPVLLHAFIVRTALIDGQRAGCSGQANLYGFRVALKDQAPLAPCRAVALVDDDVTEVVLGVVLDQEARIVLGLAIRIATDVEGLVRGDLGSERFLRVLARDEAYFATEDVEEGAAGLLGELGPVTDEERVPDVTGRGELVQ